jgi:hypothetical protein
MKRHEQAYQVRRHTLLTSMPDYGIPPTGPNTPPKVFLRRVGILILLGYGA